MTTFTATYSPEDNKLRLYASTRLDDETYARVKEAGFKWAPKQDLFFAPRWTPSREDLLIELAGEIDDEDKSLVDRAEERSERFEGYRAKRTADSEAAHNAVHRIADNIPFGQPILVGHHSERHARKDAERIENGMRKAIKMWETAGYWKARAAGALAHAKYKELPTVRARRIKGIETDLHRMEREDKERAAKLALWSKEGITIEQARELANYANPICTREGSVSGGWSAWDVLRPDSDRYKACPSWTVEQVRAVALRVYSGSSATRERWRVHYQNRIAYERAMLEEQGASDLLKPKPRRVLPPILNYRSPTGQMQHENRYHRGKTVTCRQVDMTAAEYAKIYADYRGTAFSLDKSHRFRVAMISNHERVAVYITDSKDHGQPKVSEAAHPAAAIPDAPVPVYRAPREVDERPAIAEAVDAMRATLRNGGVQVAAVPQLFPTPAHLAERMVEAAGIEDGHSVLEPSAGTGAIWVHLSGKRTAVEINQGLADRLRDKCTQRDWVICGDFLELTDLGLFHRIVMNPPFKDGADIKHIQHALRLLKPGGRLVAICANGSRQRATLMPLAESSGGYWEDLPPDTFKDQGTGVNTALLVIEAPAATDRATRTQPDLFA